MKYPSQKNLYFVHGKILTEASPGKKKNINYN